MPIRIVTTHLEFEGQVEEVRVVLEGEEPPVWGEDAQLQLVGKPTVRVDARERVTGAATYSYDAQAPGMLTAVGLRSPHPHARITKLDSARAEAMPGVRAIYSQVNAGDFKNPATGLPVFGDEMLYQGDLVALVVAETPEQAREAARAIDVTWEPLPFVVNPEAALAEGAPQVNTTRASNSISDEYPRVYERGNVERALGEAAVTVETRLETPAALHNSLETHGGAASWDGSRLTLWSSTQDVFGARKQVAQALGLP
ncbi:MAG TPA: molybdopterin cofactor-binding domain-containing protein, partial [Ktedonobacterales bacterium]|nr:molybdopterin cofactor-binding domain-containing protein [Ktedonobacterales bacterium]